MPREFYDNSVNLCTHEDELVTHASPQQHPLYTHPRTDATTTTAETFVDALDVTYESFHDRSFVDGTCNDHDDCFDGEPHKEFDGHSVANDISYDHNDKFGGEMNDQVSSAPHDRARQWGSCRAFRSVLYPLGTRSGEGAFIGPNHELKSFESNHIHASHRYNERLYAVS